MTTLPHVVDVVEHAVDLEAGAHDLAHLQREARLGVRQPPSARRPVRLRLLLDQKLKVAGLRGRRGDGEDARLLGADLADLHVLAGDREGVGRAVGRLDRDRLEALRGVLNAADLERRPHRIGTPAADDPARPGRRARTAQLDGVRARRTAQLQGGHRAKAEERERDLHFRRSARRSS